MTGLKTAHQNTLNEYGLVTTSGIPLSSKNYIINGDFDYWQRGSTTTTNVTYLADRWKVRFGNGITSYTVSRAADSTYPPYKMSLLSTGSTGGVGYMQAWHQIEYEVFKPLLGKQVTLSFVVAAKRNNAGSTNFDVAVLNDTSTKDTSLFGVGSPVSFQSFTITTTATAYSLTFTLPSNTLSLIICLGAYAQQIMAANLDGWDISRVWLNEGTQTLPFQLAGHTVGGELAACQRYFEKSYNPEEIPGQSYAYNALYLRITYSNGSQCQGFSFKVTKFKPPAVIMYNAGSTTPNQVFRITDNAQVGATPSQISVNTVGNISLAQSSDWNNTMLGHFTAEAEF